MSVDWKADIVRIAYWKQVAAEHDALRALPWHLPAVGASEAEISAAQDGAGVQFAPEFKDFLRHADGWRGFYVLTDLFGTSDFSAGRSQLALNREDVAEFLASKSIREQEAYVLGASELDLDVFIGLSPHAATLPGGVIWMAGVEVERYSSFSCFLASMVNHNARIAKQLASQGGQG